MIPKNNTDSGSFRDPSGYIFWRNGLAYRRVNECFEEEYKKLMSSGLYEILIEKKWLLPHTEVPYKEGYKTLLPLQLGMVSYPNSWAFEMLRDAALLTLRIHLTALKHGMGLKDATPYNIQFVDNQPIFIDTLSFETSPPTQPWLAYGQFCRCFLAPLALIAYRDIRGVFLNYPDGIPLPLAVNLLPFKTKFRLGLFMHLHLHARSVTNHEQRSKQASIHTSIEKHKQLIISLIDTIKALPSPSKPTEWEHYYKTDVTDVYLKIKQEKVREWLLEIRPQKVVDLGANTGIFSKIAAETASQVYALDTDPAAINGLYLSLKKEKNTVIFPLIAQLDNPEPAIGWANTERPALWERLSADTYLALALVHHLRISAGIPLEKIAHFLSGRCNYLIIEFVPKTDPKVAFLLQNRKDIFDDYTRERFIEIFGQYFILEKQCVLTPTERVLFSMKKR